MSVSMDAFTTKLNAGQYVSAAGARRAVGKFPGMSEAEKTKAQAMICAAFDEEAKPVAKKGAAKKAAAAPVAKKAATKAPIKTPRASKGSDFRPILQNHDPFLNPITYQACSAIDTCTRFITAFAALRASGVATAGNSALDKAFLAVEDHLARLRTEAPVKVADGSEEEEEGAEAPIATNGASRFAASRYAAV